MEILDLRCEMLEQDLDEGFKNGSAADGEPCPDGHIQLKFFNLSFGEFNDLDDLRNFQPPLSLL